MDPRQTVQSLIEDISQCPICHEALQDARNLPCGHTFCLGCIEKCLRYQQAVNWIKYCPLCKKDLSTLSIDRLSELPKNFIANGISDVSSRPTLGENELIGDGIGDNTNQASISEDGPQSGSNILMRTLRRLGKIPSFILVVILFVAASSANVIQILSTRASVIGQQITSGLMRTYDFLGNIGLCILIVILGIAVSSPHIVFVLLARVSITGQEMLCSSVTVEADKERDTCSTRIRNYAWMEELLKTQVKDLQDLHLCLACLKASAKPLEAQQKQDSLEIRRLEKYIDELRFPNDPALTKTFELEPAESRTAVAMTLIDGKLLIANSINGDLKLRDAYSVTKESDWSTIPSSTVAGMGLCRKNGQVFISTWNKYIFRFSRNGQLLDQWPMDIVASGVISVTDDCNIVLAVRDNSKKILIYSTYGEIISEVKMQADNLESRDSRLIKAVQISNGHFLVLYGEGDDPEHGIAITNANGQTIKSFGSWKGADIGQFRDPLDFAVDGLGNVLVADCANKRVILLDSELKFKKVLVSTKHGLQYPSGILLNECETLLYVADNQWKPMKKKWADGRIMVYRIK